MSAHTASYPGASALWNFSSPTWSVMYAVPGISVSSDGCAFLARRRAISTVALSPMPYTSRSAGASNRMLRRTLSSQ